MPCAGRRAVKRRVARPIRRFDRHGDRRRIHPVELEVAADYPVEIRPERSAAAVAGRRAARRNSGASGAPAGAASGLSAMIGVGRRVNAGQAFAAFDEVEQSLPAKVGGRLVVRVIEKFAVVLARKMASYNEVPASP